MMNKKLMVFFVLALLILVVGGSVMSAYGMRSYMEGDAAVVVRGADISRNPYQYADVDYGNMPPPMNVGCQMKSGVGLASSLLPQEPAAQETFGEFAPDPILEGQQFLDPRNQIGIPETMGGALRNANQSIRAEPPNPKRPYTWNNSTIVPDMMQRELVV